MLIFKDMASSWRQVARLGFENYHTLLDVGAETSLWWKCIYMSKYNIGTSKADFETSIKISKGECHLHTIKQMYCSRTKLCSHLHREDRCSVVTTWMQWVVSVWCVYLENTPFILRVKCQPVLCNQVLSLRLHLSWILRFVYACTKSKYNSVQSAECYLFGGYVNVTSFQSVTKYLLDGFPWTWKISVKVSTKSILSFLPVVTSSISTFVHTAWRLKSC